jgi:hypothetical protein
MDKVRAEILKVDYPLTAAARISIAAPAQKIFEYLADPYAHAYFDGSGTVAKGAPSTGEVVLGCEIWNGYEDFSSIQNHKQSSSF